MVVQLTRKQLPETWFREQVKDELLPAASVLCEFVGTGLNPRNSGYRIAAGSALGGYGQQVEFDAMDRAEVVARVSRAGQGWTSFVIAVPAA